MKEGWLNFEEKPMQMDTDLFQVQANYVELVQILMVGASIGMSKVETPLSEDEVNQALEEFEKEEEFLFPPAGDTLLEFLTKK